MILQTFIILRWLLVVLNYHNFDEAKIVLKYMLNTISIIENIEGRKLSIPYLYYAVSQYYYIFMEFDKVGYVFHKVECILRPTTKKVISLWDWNNDFLKYSTSNDDFWEK